ncbi:MarR family transcriptional regulator [Microbacterium sp. Root61]|uniref:MarR family winged helix-turn-helix transcriptional regulator n=1 Tax=Microbacterium sp. Root61 TaxID=1736570 RepID=UPI0006F38161|nr:MarR family transcriptional regulator [Microbacterium sp. Root61]KRA24678.1 MarR family transcriptional regulator [Microbacterium sp. Root61]
MTKRGRLPIDPIAEAQRQWESRGWTDSAPGMAAVTSVMRAQQLMLNRVNAALRPFDLSFARFEMLRLLSFTREGRMPMRSATARLQVHPASVTNTVDRLERDALVLREPHPVDGRSIMLVLTPSGRALAENATAALNADVFSALEASPDDVATLVGVIGRFRHNAGDFGPADEDPFW